MSKHRKSKLDREGNRRMERALQNWSAKIKKQKRELHGSGHVAKIAPKDMRGEVSSFGANSREGK
jgi:hypothetical protein